MITISLCMIVKDEEDTLGRCLESVKDVIDEFVIVDTGSTDRTKEIAQKYAGRVYNYKWINDFSAARNYSFSKATQEYIMWLDADDILLEEDAKKLTELKKTLDPGVDSVTMKYNVAFDEYGNATSSYRRNRLIKRERNFRWIGFVHEYVEVYGKIINSDIAVTHRKIRYASSDRNLEIYRNKLAEGLEFTPRDILYYANELYDHQLYEEALKYYDEFLDSKRGWVEDNIKVCRKISDYYRGQGKEEEVRKYAYRSFEYSSPRAEACCRLGFSFLQEKKLEQAVFWYEMAANMEKPKDSWGFFEDSCWTWLPHLQLCVCYDKLGKQRLAFEHNEIVAKYRPDDARMLYNRKYFKGLGIE